MLYNNMHSEFHKRIRDNARGIALYAFVAPNESASVYSRTNNLNRIRDIMNECNPDGIIIYDVQEEKCRGNIERPFRFNKKEPAHIYSQFLTENLQGTNIITYIALPNENISSVELTNRMDEIIRRDIKTVVFVGGSSKVIDSTCDTIYSCAMLYKKKILDINAGAVTLPDRYIKSGWNEHDVLLNKTLGGSDFFVSQIVYNFESIEKLLRLYSAGCIDNNIKPARIIFTFALFAENKTIQFMRCLGIDIPPEIDEKLGTNHDKSYIEYSMELCICNWIKILDLKKELGIPVGFSVDIVSGNKMEYSKSIELYKKLENIMKELY